METVVLSLHERWWRKMVSGDKGLEIRKTYPRCADNHQPFRVLVYVTGGVGVCGEFTCPAVHKIRTLVEVQPTFGADRRDLEAATCLTRQQLAGYAGTSGKPLWGWEVSTVKEYQKPVPLQLYGMARPPQSWQYFYGPEPAMVCAVCGKPVDQVKPCGYNRKGKPTCDACCDKCFMSEPFPCWEHELRKRQGEGTKKPDRRKKDGQ